MPDITPALYSHNMRTKSKTYFFDVREAKNGKKYLTISETWTAQDGQKKRGTLTVFADNLAQFADTVADMQEKVR